MAIPAPGSYSFQMQLPPGVNVSVRARATGVKDDSKDSAKGVKIEREIRKGIVRVRQQSGATKMCDRYYVPGWCAFDDPRMGINVRREGFEGLFQPLSAYHFPELIWAEPKTRLVDPNARDKEKKIETYQLSGFTLEVDALTHRPIRFRNGNAEEWTYSYKNDSSPIVIPANLDEPVRRALGKL